MCLDFKWHARMIGVDDPTAEHLREFIGYEIELWIKYVLYDTVEEKEFYNSL